MDTTVYTDGQPVTLTFNSFDVGKMPLPATSPLTSYIWSPNYPNSHYVTNYQQVRDCGLPFNVIYASCFFLDVCMYDDLPQEWTLHPTDAVSVTLTFSSFDVGRMPLPAQTTGTSYIWTPNYPYDYPDNYQQVN